MPIEINEVPIRVEPAVDRPSPGANPASSASVDSVAPRPARPPSSTIPSVRWYGVYSALVIDNQDPDALGRVLIRLGWIPDAGGLVGIQKGQEYHCWARLATMTAGKDRGSWFPPESGDEVLVSFEGGHPSRPVVLGALWNGVDTPPASADAQNTVKMLRTRGGSEVRFDDTSDQETVEIRTANGQSIRVGGSAGGVVEITDGKGNTVTMGSAGLSLTSPSKVTLSASSITLEAGVVTLDAGMVKCSGVVQSDTLITNSVVASSYTPGAGNIW